MEVSIRDKRLESNEARLKYYPALARKINQRLAELRAAANLEDLKHLPGRWHELTGNLKGCLAGSVSANYRLLIKPNHNPVPRKDDGGLNWREVTAITVLEVMDYH
jgi:plasmid maintenance system killer protein